MFIGCAVDLASFNYMVNKESCQADRIFHALSDSTRRSMLERIAQSNVSVADLREPFPISGPAISKHLKVLEKAGLIIRKVDGKQWRFEVNGSAVSLWELCRICPSANLRRVS